MFYDRISRFPPCLVRLLARHETEYRPLTNTEIAARTNGVLGPWPVAVLSNTTSWDGIELAKLRAFTRACRCDFDNAKDMRRVEDYIRKSPTFRYVRLSPDYDQQFKPLFVSWRKSYGVIEPTADIWPPLRRLLIRLNPLLK